MLRARLYLEDDEIDARLAEFGPTRDELVEVVRAVVAARADAVEDDPASAEGLFAYIFGTRFTRRAFLKHGYHRHRQENVESVKHPDRNLKVIYQSVDLAADLFHQPQAVAGKGAGADRLISAAQGSLFADEDLADARMDTIRSLKTGTWFLCVSVEGENVRAELSLPSGVANGNFGPFIERIFIVREGEWARIYVSPIEDAAEFEPIVTRKK